MKKLCIGLLLVAFSVPQVSFSQGEFFGSEEVLLPPSEDTQDTEKAPDPKDASVVEKKPEQDINSNQGIVVLADRVKIRVNNLILTERQLSIFFALRKLSSFLSKLNTLEDVQKEMTLILGLEAYAKSNNLYNLLPTRNEMDTRIEFLNNNTHSQSLAESVLKIDPAGNLTQTDIRQFFYYQILREKGFVYALQQDFLDKMFSPREDEILLLYKQVLLSDPKIFQSPAQLYVMNITAVEPVNKAKKDQLIKALERVKDSINREPELGRKERLFVSAIQKYSSPHLKNTNVVGPLDETLVNEDFPEYKELFNLKAGGISHVLDQDGFIRLVFAKQKDEGEIKPVTTPEIKQKIINIIYDTKGDILFRSFLQDNLHSFDVEIMGQ